MRNWTWSAVLIAMLATGPLSAQMASGTQVDSEIRSLLEHSAAAWNRGDLDGHLADNADSITFMTSKGPIIGKTGTADALRRSFFRDGMPIQSLRFEQVTIRPLGGEHARVIHDHSS